MPTDISQQSTRPRDSSAPSVSTIGEDLTILGDVISKGKLHLDGHVQGDVHCLSLVLGENSQLEGSVIAEDVVVQGCLIGSVRALRVTLLPRSHVEGDLFHQSLSMEQGAYFEGESRRCEDLLVPNQETTVAGAAATVEVAERFQQCRDMQAKVVYPISH